MGDYGYPVIGWAANWMYASPLPWSDAVRDTYGPLAWSGMFTKRVINVGTAALAFLIGGGGLGETINTGLKLQRDVVIVVGAAMTALVALSVDWVAALVQRMLTPRGLS